ncbi:hypothetical protein E0K89_016435 [Aquicoccus sp. SCR17]|nr:hypothetical protein [Carideicomes alvinocaridis]
MRHVGQGDRALNYFPCRYGGSRLLFRGPRRDLSGAYLAFLGGTETYGKFLPRPYPAVVEQALGLPCVNLGGVNAGVDLYLRDPALQALASGAVATVVQLTGAQNLSNRFYSVHPRRNDRFLRSAGPLHELYPEVDFTRFHFTRHMLAALRDTSDDRFALVQEELRTAWLARMRQLIAQIAGPVVLLWFADHSPPDPGAPEEAADPLFVTRPMVEAVRDEAAHCLEVVITDRARAAGTQGMVFAVDEELAASELPGALAHEEAADALAPLLRDIAVAAGALDDGP